MVKNMTDIRRLPAGFVIGDRLYETICYFDRYSNPKARPSSYDSSKLLVRNIETREEIGIKLPLRLHPDTKYEELKTPDELAKTKERKAWEVFSLYIRLKYSNSMGICKCFTCGKGGYYDEMDCGHYLDRRFKSTMFDEINNHPQCHHCNRVLDGDEANLATYRANLIKKYGEEEVLKLEDNKMEMFNESMSEIYREYKKKLDDLKRGKFRHIFYPRAK